MSEPPSDDGAASFWQRWSRRKQSQQAQPAASLEPQQAAAAAPAPPLETPGGELPEPRTLPTLDDVQALHAQSDFKPFMQQGVAPQVRNAAMKRLFEDPHFNVMDGLDVYIDDYGRPDPLPPQMLRQMASAQFLKLFEHEEATTTDTADVPVAATTPIPHEAPASTEHEQDPDLRLQPNDPAGPAGT